MRDKAKQAVNGSRDQITLREDPTHLNDPDACTGVWVLYIWVSVWLCYGCALCIVAKTGPDTLVDRLVSYWHPTAHAHAIAAHAGHHPAHHTAWHRPHSHAVVAE